MGKFLPYGEGDADEVFYYLLKSTDREGGDRKLATVLVGNPDITAKLINSLSFTLRYTSGVIGFAKDDNPSETDIAELVGLIERLGFAGLERCQYDWCVVLHQSEDGRKDMHFIVPRVELLSGRSMNIAPPGAWMAWMDAIRDYMNHSKGWARPDDPLRRRATRPRRGATKEFAPWGHATPFKLDPHSELSERVALAVQRGDIRDRTDVIAFLRSLGGEVHERPKALGFRTHPSAKIMWLRGPVFESTFNGKLHHPGKQADEAPTPKIDLEAAARARQRIEDQFIKRRAANQARYRLPPALAPPEALTDAVVGIHNSSLKVVPTLPNPPNQLIPDGDGRYGSSATQYFEGDQRNPVPARVIQPGLGARFRELAQIVGRQTRRVRKLLERCNSAVRASAELLSQHRGTARKVDRALVMMDRQANDELEQFKREIPLAAYAESIGFVIDRDKSSVGSLKLVRDAEMILLKRSPAGHWVYCGTGDEGQGTIVDFAQRFVVKNLGQVRKALRPWIGKSVWTAVETVATSTARRARHRSIASIQDSQRPYHGHFLQKRGLNEATIQAFGIGQDSRGNAVFPHVGPDGKLCGYELRNDKFKGFSKGGHRGLFVKSTDELPTTTIVICESALDTMSLAQLNSLPDGWLYVSTAGHVTDYQIDAIQSLADRYDDAEVLVATDNDERGEEFAQSIIKRLAGRQNVARALPEFGKDWNDALQATQGKVQEPAKGIGFPR